MRKLLYILGLSVWSVSMLAQTSAPDLQTHDQVFFDPNANKEDPYVFQMEYRLEGGYVQHWQHSKTNISRMYLHGGRLGATFDFLLPYHFSAQVGLLYTLAYGKQAQKYGVVDEEESYASSDSIFHRVTEHSLAVPIRVYYTIKLWQKLNLFFYGGPQVMVGLAQIDNIDNRLPAKATAFYTSQGVPMERYNRYEKELYPVNIQMGLGGGLEWDCYRLQAGYDFGLNNLSRNRQLNDLHLWEWSWFVSFAYRLPVKQ